MNSRSMIDTIGGRGLVLAVGLFVCVFGESLASSIVIDISVNNRGGQGIATVTLFQPSPTVLYSGFAGDSFTYDLSGIYNAFGVDEPGLDYGEVWTETGLFFGSPSAPEGTRWPFYWFALQGRHFSYLYLGDFTEEQAAYAVTGHVNVPLATLANPAPGGVGLAREFATQDGGSFVVLANVHTRVPETGSLLGMLALAQSIVLLAARLFRNA